MNRTIRAQQAAETVAILKQGTYRSPSGITVDIAAQLRNCVTNTRVITPSEWDTIVIDTSSVPERRSSATVEVTDETTLAAARRLVQKAGCEGVMLLNFASAKDPGGGFLHGSQAQEESLARSSGLYASLQAGELYYRQNRNQQSALYTDHAIFSPAVPVFREDDGSLLDTLYSVSFITMPAANVSALPAGSPDRAQVEAVMAGRIEKVYALAVRTKHEQLVLGAWGCGVFRNDPRMIARLFRECLFGPNRWAWRLERVVFAVFDRPPFGVLRAFQQAFADVVTT